MDKEQRITTLENIILDIQKELQELKQNLSPNDLKDGDWIHLTCFNTSYILKFKQILGYSCGAYLAYNESENKFYENDNNFFSNENHYKIRVATLQEVQYALLKIAEHKGYKNGIRFKTTFPSGIVSKIEGDIISDNFNLLTNDSPNQRNQCIYNNKTNAWGEILKEFEIVPGYPVEYIDKDTCKINNNKYQKIHVIELLNGLEGINDSKINLMVIPSLNVGCSGQFKLTMENLKELLSKWPV